MSRRAATRWSSRGTSAPAALTLFVLPFLPAVAKDLPMNRAYRFGRLADEVASLKEEPSWIEDPTLAEIIEEGDLHIFPINRSPEDFERMLLSQSPNVKLLHAAWKQFATYDVNAIWLLKAIRKIQFWILTLAVIAVFLAVFQTEGLDLVRRQQVKALTEHSQPAESAKPYQSLENALGWLRYPLIVIPILTALLLAYYNKFRPANRWILLRAALTP